MSPVMTPNEDNTLQELRTRIDDIELLLDVDERIGATLDLSEVLRLVLQEGLKIAGCDRGDIRLFDSYNVPRKLDR